MSNTENNKITVSFVCGENIASAMGLLSAVFALDIGLKGARMGPGETDDTDAVVVIDPAQLDSLREILSQSPLKNAFAKAESNPGTMQTDIDGEKSFSVMITAPTV